MFWSRRKPNLGLKSRALDLWRPQGAPPKVAQAARVVFSDGREHARGWVVAVLPCGDRVICDPDPGHQGEPWIASWPPHQVEAITDSPDYAHDIITATADGLTTGAKARVYIRERDERAKAVFVVETMGRRYVQFSGGGSTSYPAEDVTPFSITADSVRAMRGKLQISMQESIRVLKGRALREELELASSVDDLRPILEALLDQAYPELHPSLLAAEARLNQDD